MLQKKQGRLIALRVNFLLKYKFSILKLLEMPKARGPKDNHPSFNDYTGCCLISVTRNGLALSVLTSRCVTIFRYILFKNNEMSSYWICKCFSVENQFFQVT